MEYCDGIPWFDPECGGCVSGDYVNPNCAACLAAVSKDPRPEIYFAGDAFSPGLH